MAILNEFTGRLKEYLGIEQVFVSGLGVPNFTRGIRVNGANVSATELSALDVTLGAETASKAVTLDANRLFDSGRITRKLSSIAAASTALSATSATAFSNGTVTIPASFLEAGDVIRFRAAVRVATVDGTDSFRVLALYAGATLFDTTAIAAAEVDQIVVVEGEITTRTAHATTGTAVATFFAGGAIGETSLGGLAGYVSLSNLANAAAHTLVIQGAFGGAGNTAVLEQLDVYHN